MKRRYRIQIIPPKIVGPATWAPSMRTPPAMPSISSTLNRRPSASGDPTMSPRKIVRFDQSIWPSDRSNTRMAAARNGGAWRTGPSAHGRLTRRSRHDRIGCGVAHLTRNLKTACRLSSGEVTSVISPARPSAASSVRYR